MITSQRTQNASDVLKVNTKTGEATKLFTETDDKWIDTDNVTLGVFRRQQFGDLKEILNRHLYWYDKDGKLKKQVTKGNWEVTGYYGYNPKSKEIFVQTTEKEASIKLLPKSI